jgi:hypothetical protein
LSMMICCSIISEMMILKSSIGTDISAPGEPDPTIELG